MFSFEDTVITNQDRDELELLRARVQELEAEVRREQSSTQWSPKGFYTEYYATAGFILGMFGAMASLLVNVIGAPMAGKSPLELIRIYLTFPLGEKALQLATTGNNVYVIGDGLLLSIGCCMYIATGMVLGIPFYLALVWLTETKTTLYRLGVATVLAAAIWGVNFWGILSWLQPALLGGRWITDGTLLPGWVALVTHLVFGWTLALLYPWARFQPYQQPATGRS